MSAHTPTSSFEELMSRDSNGIHVSLLWDRTEDNVRVGVYEIATDTAFHVDVCGNSPLDVFNHPYAYAAFQHVEYAPAFGPSPIEAIAA